MSMSTTTGPMLRMKIGVNTTSTSMTATAAFVAVAPCAPRYDSPVGNHVVDPAAARVGDVPG